VNVFLIFLYFFEQSNRSEKGSYLSSSRQPDIVGSKMKIKTIHSKTAGSGSGAGLLSPQEPPAAACRIGI